MAREGVDADAAFDRLRQQSQTRNVKLRAIAQEVVDSTRRP
jgi:AmiR/NasT family two-component response regulator